MADEPSRAALKASLRAARAELALREREKAAMDAWLQDFYRSRIYRLVHGLRNVLRRLRFKPPIPLAENVFTARQGLGGVDMQGLQPWLAGLQHGPNPEARFPLLLWGVGADEETILAACDQVQAWIGEHPDWAPVLITDQASFSAYSRLGWLVEYVPRPNGPEAGVLDWRGKLFHLARLYRGAPVIPLMNDLDAESGRLLLDWISQAYD